MLLAKIKKIKYLFNSKKDSEEPITYNLISQG